jgi:three-Cys-motif partner protein
MERVSSRRRRGPLSLGLSPDSDAPLVVPNDGLPAPVIKPHSLDKIRAHNRFARMFARAMHSKWPQLAYIGLYSGAGHAELEDGRRVQTSALSILTQPDPFTHCVLVENDPTWFSALESRCQSLKSPTQLRLIKKDVNDSIGEVRAGLPRYRKGFGLLSFCFVDPFNAGLHFAVIKALSDLRVDFLILLMLGNDVRRNIETYYHDPTNNRMADLLDCPTWREEFRKDGNIVRCSHRLFDEAMQRLGYPSAVNAALPIYAHGTKVLQYRLAFYSKDEVGMKLWHHNLESLSRLDAQTTLELR